MMRMVLGECFRSARSPTSSIVVVRVQQVVAAHARLARDAGGDDDDVGLGGFGVVVGADDAESKPSIGPGLGMSRPLPCGTPSTMSTRTTSASSLSAMRCAAVAPTLPAPTTVTFDSWNSGMKTRWTLHVGDDGVGELRGLQLGRSFHQTRQVVGHLLLLDRRAERRLDQARRLVPAEYPNIITPTGSPSSG